MASVPLFSIWKDTMILPGSIQWIAHNHGQMLDSLCLFGGLCIGNDLHKKTRMVDTEYVMFGVGRVRHDATKRLNRTLRDKNLKCSAGSLKTLGYIVEEIYGQTHGIWMSQSAELQLLVTSNDVSPWFRKNNSVRWPHFTRRPEPPSL